jgi:hypothetical protein
VFVRAIVLLPPALHLGSGGAGCVCRGHSPTSAFALSASQRRGGAFVGAIASLPPSCLSHSSQLIYIICLFTDFFGTRQVHYIGKDSFDTISLLTTFPHFLNLARFLGDSFISVQGMYIPLVRFFLIFYIFTDYISAFFECGQIFD